MLFLLYFSMLEIMVISSFAGVCWNNKLVLRTITFPSPAHFLFILSYAPREWRLPPIMLFRFYAAAYVLKYGL